MQPLDRICIQFYEELMVSLNLCIAVIPKLKGHADGFESE